MVNMMIIHGFTIAKIYNKMITKEYFLTKKVEKREKSGCLSTFLP